MNVLKHICACDDFHGINSWSGSPRLKLLTDAADESAELCGSNSHQQWMGATLPLHPHQQSFVYLTEEKCALLAFSIFYFFTGEIKCFLFVDSVHCFYKCQLYILSFF